MAERALYLFAVTRGIAPDLLRQLEGIHDSQVSVVEHRGLEAITCPVDLTEFGEEPLKANLERLPWLEDVARTHDAVVQAVAQTSTVAPMRLVTICSDEQSVRDRLDALYEGLERALDRVEGCHEWSIKAFMPEPAQPPAEVAPRPASGADYLKQRRAELSARAEIGERAAELAEAVHRDASTVSKASRRLAPQDPRLSGFPGTMILNGAYLVEDDQVELFQELVSQLQIEYPDAGVDVRGPWPPYSFATLE